MGAYLSEPKKDKVSTDEESDYLVVGSSSMQGWRNSQEDAHNAILNYDANTSFFAVYDGHGGADVSSYCADRLPGYLLNLEAYKADDLETALRDAFLGFDRTLLEPDVIEILKLLAGERNYDDCAEDEEDDDEDLAELQQEGSLPLDEVLEKYKGCPMPSASLQKVKNSNVNNSNPSPYLRGRRLAAMAAESVNKAVLDPDSKPAGSSTSAAAAAAFAAAKASSIDEPGPSSSKASIEKLNNEQEDDSTVSSSSSSGNKNNNAIVRATAGIEAEPSTSTIKRINANGTDTANIAPDSSHLKENDQNGNVTTSAETLPTETISTTAPSSTSSSAAVAADVVISTAAAPKIVTADTTVSGSNDVVENQTKQNGNVETSTNSSTSAAAIDLADISSTTFKNPRVYTTHLEDDSDDDDFDVENSRIAYAIPLTCSSDEEEEEDDEDDEEELEDDEDSEMSEDEADLDGMQLVREQFSANMIEEPGKDSGCTAVVALLRGRDLYVANAGDSRAVVCRNGKAIEMSFDHKPEDDEECTRIINAGGRVTPDGRVNGGLNLSRAIGDHAYKMNTTLPAEEQMISAVPDIKKLIIGPEDEFMILACDGIWNFMSSDDVVDFVRLRIKNAEKVSKICEELFDHCLAPNTKGDGTGCDNMTAVIIVFKPKILEKPTKINANETEDVLQLQAAMEADIADETLQKALKRSASPTTNIDESNEAKRTKTDATSITTTTTVNVSNQAEAANVSTNNTDETANSSITSSTSSDASTAEHENECDSVTAASSEATAAAPST